MDVNNLVICLCPGMVGGLGDMRDELEMCRVPGTTRGFVPGVKKSGGSNTIGGVLKILIERCFCFTSEGIGGERH